MQLGKYTKNLLNNYKIKKKCRHFRWEVDTIDSAVMEPAAADGKVYTHSVIKNIILHTGSNFILHHILLFHIYTNFYIYKYLYITLAEPLFKVPIIPSKKRTPISLQINTLRIYGCTLRHTREHIKHYISNDYRSQPKA